MSLLQNASDFLRGPPRYKTDTPWTPVQALLMIVLVVLLFFALGYGALSLAMKVFYGDVTRVDNKIALSEFDWGILGLFFMVGGQIVVILMMLLTTARRGATLEGVLSLKPFAGGFLFALLVTVFFTVAAIAVFTIIYALFPYDWLADIREIALVAQSDYWWLVLIVVSIGAPFSEELVFRGFLFSTLANTPLGIIGASLITGGLWTLLHYGYSVQALSTILIMSFLLSYILWRFGSLWLCILCHAVYNTAVFIDIRWFVELK